MGIFDITIWGVGVAVCSHCKKKIKFWQDYVRPSNYVIHEKCFDDYMKGEGK